MKIRLISLYTVLALVLSATGGMCREEGCPEDTPPTTPTRTQAAAAPPVDPRWVDVLAYEKSISMKAEGSPLLVAGTTVCLVPHEKGVIDVRHGPAFCPQSFVDFIEQQVAKVGTPLQIELAGMNYQSDVRQRLEGAYATFIDPIVQRHTKAVRQLAVLGIAARQEDRVFVAINTFPPTLTAPERADALRLCKMFCEGEFPDPRVHLEASNALLRAARIVELQKPCAMLNVINARW